MIFVFKWGFIIAVVCVILTAILEGISKAKYKEKRKEEMEKAKQSGALGDIYVASVSGINIPAVALQVVRLL
jgi:hypothetical protein